MNDFDPDPLAEVSRWDRMAERIETPFENGHLVWRSWGQGRPLILLHGGSGSWRHWIRNLPALVPARRVLAVDLPGLGDSDLPPEPFSVPSIATLLASGLERMLRPGETCDVMGFSFGAQIAGNLAAQLCRQVGTLVMVGASGLGLPRASLQLHKVRERTGAERTAAHRANLETIMFADPARIDAQAIAIQAWNSDHTRLRSLRQANTTVLLDALRRVTARRCAIWGTDDAIARANLRQRIDIMHSLPGGTDVRTIPGAGHWVAYEAADSFNLISTELLSAV